MNVKNRAERPVILSSGEVSNIINGEEKTFTKPNGLIPSWDHYGTDIMDWGLSGVYKYRGEWQPKNTWVVDIQSDVDDSDCFFIKCPFGVVGDTLYVRESWRGYVETNHHDADTVLEVPIYTPDEDHCNRIEYKADGLCGKFKSPVSMPKWASRITLEITSINVGRVDRGVWQWVVGFKVI